MRIRGYSVRKARYALLLLLILCVALGCGGRRRMARMRALDLGDRVGVSRSTPSPQPTGASRVSSPTEHTVDVGGLPRTYWVYVPRGYVGDRPSPLLLVFHGGGQNPQRFWEVSQLNETAEEYNFLAVYLAGSGRSARILTWNAGECCAYAQENNVDDVGFTAAVIRAVRRDFAVDTRRIYVTGASNGAMMAHRIACELSDRIAAIAAVAGPLVYPPCAPRRPVSILHIHGTADRNIPYNGGPGKRVSTIFPPVRRATADWAWRDGCAETSPSRGRVNGLIWESWGPCREGTEVVLATRDGGVHEWLPQENRVIWEFFARHPQ